MKLVDMRALGAELILDGGGEPARLWFPTVIKALLAKAQLEGNDRLRAFTSEHGARHAAARSGSPHDG